MILTSLSSWTTVFGVKVKEVSEEVLLKLRDLALKRTLRDILFSNIADRGYLKGCKGNYKKRERSQT